MKKHPVDDLFQKRLTSLEKKPTELAWKRIQEGQKNKSPRMVAWVWYAAASVILTIITGYLVWQGKDDMTSPQAQVAMNRVEQIVPAIVEPKDLLPGKDDFVEKNQVENKTTTQAPVLAKVKEQKQYEKGSLRTVEVKASVAENLPQVAKIETAKPNEVKLYRPDIQTSPVADKVTPKPVELAVVEEKKPDRTIIVEIEESVQDTKEKSKPTRFARVFRQLKNVREAEPVDWDDIGFNPISIIARADDRTNEDEKVSGKRERKN
jgi:hypothetical protein